jgi:hypothetical protein
VVVGQFNVAPVANPTTVTNAFAATTGPEVTITDDKTAPSVANNSDVTYTLTFSEAINASTLTESDITVTNGSLKAGTLTRVNDTTWTVQATTPTTGSGTQILELTGAYAAKSGAAGDNGNASQGFGTFTPTTVNQVIDNANLPLSFYSQELDTAILSNGTVVTGHLQNGTLSYVDMWTAGGDFVKRVNTVLNFAASDTTQRKTSVTAMSDGGFLLVAEDLSSGGTSTTTSVVWAQKYTANGDAVGSAVQLHLLMLTPTTQTPLVQVTTPWSQWVMPVTIWWPMHDAFLRQTRTSWSTVTLPAMSCWAPPH